MKICHVATKLFHVDGKMDRHDEANTCFLQFCECTQILFHLLALHLFYPHGFTLNHYVSITIHRRQVEPCQLASCAQTLSDLPNTWSQAWVLWNNTNQYFHCFNFSKLLGRRERSRGPSIMLSGRWEWFSCEVVHVLH
jgi:hypothetical protein